MAAGAAFWVRVGSQLTRDADFDAWRKDFDKRDALRCRCVRPTASTSRRRAKTDHSSITASRAVGPGGPGATRAETVSRRAGSRRQGTRPSAAGRRRTALFVATGNGAAVPDDRACRKGLLLGGRVGPGPARHGHRRRCPGVRRPLCRAGVVAHRPAQRHRHLVAGDRNGRAAIGFGPGCDRPTAGHGRFRFK